METSPEYDACSPSTTWEWRRVKIEPRSAAQDKSRAKRGASRLRVSRNMRDPLTVTLKYRGGAEAWVEVRARGEVLRVPGVTALYDVLKRINGQ